MDKKKIIGWVLTIGGGIISSIGSALIYGYGRQKKTENSESGKE